MSFFIGDGIDAGVQSDLQHAGLGVEDLQTKILFLEEKCEALAMLQELVSTGVQAGCPTQLVDGCTQTRAADDGDSVFRCAPNDPELQKLCRDANLMSDDAGGPSMDAGTDLIMKANGPAIPDDQLQCGRCLVWKGIGPYEKKAVHFTLA